MDKNKEIAEYMEQLESTDQNIRSKAAVNLHKANHPYALEACIKTINDAPDLLHMDYTPSVHCLIEIGEPALPLVIELLVAEDEMTRLRALRVVEGITLTLWKTKSTLPEKEIMNQWQQWWLEVNYSYKGDISIRRESVKKIKDWISEREKVKNKE